MRHTSAILCVTIFVIMFGIEFSSTYGTSSTNGTTYDKIDSPRLQLEQGVLSDEIVCKEGLELVIRTILEPACLTPETVIIMSDRGMILEHIGVTFVPQNNIDTVVSDIQASNKVQRDNETSQPPTSFDMSDIQASNKVQREDKSEPASTVPHSQNIVPVTSIVDFYISDQDLNISRSGVDIVDTRDLVEITIDGIVIEPPKSLTETGANTGIFHGRLTLPDTVNGMSLKTNDVVVIRYFDESDYSGNSRIQTQWLVLRDTFAQMETRGDDSRLGHKFTLRLYDPDSNFDSRERDRISLVQLEFRTERGIRTTLDNTAFSAEPHAMLETDLSTGIFEVSIKIPRYIDNEIVHIGDKYEIRYIDLNTPSKMAETIVFKGKIG